MMSLATGVRSTQPGPLDAFTGQGPHRSTLFWLMPISTVSWSRAHTPGALPSRPPELTRMTLALLVAKRPRLSADHIGRIQTPRSRMRVAVKPSNVVMRFLPSDKLLVVGNSWKEKTPYSSSAYSPEKQPCARLFLNDPIGTLARKRRLSGTPAAGSFLGGTYQYARPTPWQPPIELPSSTVVGLTIQKPLAGSK